MTNTQYIFIYIYTLICICVETVNVLSNFTHEINDAIRSRGHPLSCFKDHAARVRATTSERSSATTTNSKSLSLCCPERLPKHAALYYSLNFLSDSASLLYTHTQTENENERSRRQLLWF